jgi:hypothetical protein
MQWGLQNYVIIPTENIYIKFKIKKKNSLQLYDIAENYRILHKVVRRLYQHNPKISKYHHIQNLSQRN